jgi:tRNA U54 and U55 pseudouridine synthase Pus10
VTRKTDAAKSRAGKADAAAGPLPEDRPMLLVLHREARRRRDAEPLMSEARAEAAYEIERIEIQIARIERAMDPPLV